METVIQQAGVSQTGGLPSSHTCAGVLIKTRGNKGYRKGLAAGLSYVLDYFRRLKRRGKSPPAFVTVSRILRELGLEDNHRNRTLIGWALNHLASNGYVEKWSNGRNKAYHLTDKLYEHLRAYPCLKGCESDSSICGLLGTLECPFLQGIPWGDCDGESIA